MCGTTVFGLGFGSAPVDFFLSGPGTFLSSYRRFIAYKYDVILVLLSKS